MYVEKPETAKRFSIALKKRAKLLSRGEVLLCPPFTLLPTLSEQFKRSSAVRLGAQTLAPGLDPKYTGGITAGMLKAFGASAVIVGHSERRAAGESDEDVRMQIAAAHAGKLAAILCVGERERDASGSHFSFIEHQLSVALKDKPTGKLIVAYEPVWAIGKSAQDAMRPQELEEMSIFIRKTLANILGRERAQKVPVLYGGSVEGSNARELFTEGSIAGFLVGHASTDERQFLEILEACLA